jgi:hypothetical protein
MSPMAAAARPLAGLEGLKPRLRAVKLLASRSGRKWGKPSPWRRLALLRLNRIST